MKFTRISLLIVALAATGCSINVPTGLLDGLNNLVGGNEGTTDGTGEEAGGGPEEFDDCVDTCEFANDGECDDSSLEGTSGACAPNSDCTDCDGGDFIDF